MHRKNADRNDLIGHVVGDRQTPAEWNVDVLNPSEEGVTRRSDPCPLMGWSGRAPAPPGSEAGKGRQRRGARHVLQAQFWNRRDRYRYRQELVSRGGSRQARGDHAAAEVVTRAGGNTAGQPAAVSDRHGGLRWGASSQPQAADTGTRRSPDAGEVRAPVFQGTKE